MSEYGDSTRIHRKSFEANCLLETTFKDEKHTGECLIPRTTARETVFPKAVGNRETLLMGLGCSQSN